MKEFARVFFAALLAGVCLFVFAVIVIGSIVGIASTKKSKIKDHSYLIVDIHGEILSYNPPDDIMAEIFGGQPETLHRILGNLEKAAVDKRIEGVVFKVSSSNTLGAASMEEIRHAIKKVRDAGKPVLAYSDALNRQSLFLAAACDSIYMPVSTELMFAGIGFSRSYLKQTLEKLGIKPQIHKIDEYKSAAEIVLRENMSPEAREMTGWIVDDMWAVGMKALVEDRGIPESRLLDHMEYAMFLSEEAAEVGLIDRVLYWDELEDMLKHDDDEKLRTVSMSAYEDIDREKLGLKGKKRIAVVHAHGTIGGRKSRVDPMLGIVMGHETVGRELRRALEDDDIDAVVFRVDSPGGESVASDLIGHEVERLSRKKPVVVSMINVAASGGYHIAFKANKVIADHLTITGSIGSISGKFNMKGMYNKLGITFDHFSKGPNGLIWSPYIDFTDEQWERFEDNHWKSFNIWLEDVAEVRDIPIEELKKLAMGRVWTGAQAVDNGLIDELGGLDRAIALAKELADIPEDDDVTLEHYPKKKDLLEMVTGGRAPIAAMRWILYRFIRQDLAETLEIMTSRAAYTEAVVSD